MLDDISKLEDASQDYINIENLLELYPESELESTLSKVVSKLRHKGTISLYGKSLSLVVNMKDTYLINNSQFRENLFSGKSIYDIDEIISLALKLGLFVKSKKYNGHFYSLDLGRP